MADNNSSGHQEEALQEWFQLRKNRDRDRWEKLLSPKTIVELHTVHVNEPVNSTVLFFLSKLKLLLFTCSQKNRNYYQENALNHNCNFLNTWAESLLYFYHDSHSVKYQAYCNLFFKNACWLSLKGMALIIWGHKEEWCRPRGRADNFWSGVR